MTRFFLTICCFISMSLGVSVNAFSQSSRTDFVETESVKASIVGGVITSLDMKDDAGAWRKITFYDEKNDNRGPMWVYNGKPIALNRVNATSYAITRDGMELKLSYETKDKALCVVAEARNTGKVDLHPQSLGLRLGVNTYMTYFDEFKSLLFPTLLRCEKTHLWGYFQSPMGDVLGITVSEPVASYQLSYAGNGHRILTATLDLLHKKPLPPRHPQENDVLKAGESRKWHLYLTPVQSVAKVKQTLAAKYAAPMIDAVKYTLEAGEMLATKVFSSSSIKEVSCLSPSGKQIKVKKRSLGSGAYELSSPSLTEAGVYRLQVCNGKHQSEAMFTIRRPWAWYMKQAKKACVDHPAKGADCCESWYGLYSGLLGQKYDKDAKMDSAVFAQFKNIYDMTYDAVTGRPKLNVSRIQNHATTCGMLVDMYEVTGDTSCLVKAGVLADFLISRQNAKGAYVGPSGDYTCVIYPAKSVMELMEKERTLALKYPSSSWQQRYEKHYASVKRAMDNVIEVGGDFHTEGEQTYEDGTYSCGATQLSQFALLQDSPAERNKYRDAALRCIRYHQALEQELIPDSRINGGSLRFWEAQYDVLLKGDNMMNSPHGWTAWTIYGLMNLYELTGDVFYLQKGMNTLGSCVQLMGFDGELRWGFIADPYKEVQVFVHDKESDNPWGAGKYVPAVIGESYVDMITDWFRTPPGMNVRGYIGQGGSCDNDVHEVFKAMEEVALTKAYVAQRTDGSLLTYNCNAVLRDGCLYVTVSEEWADKVHLNLGKGTSYQLTFPNGKKVRGVFDEMGWYGDSEK